MDYLATWAETLDNLLVGQRKKLEEGDIPASVYSAIQTHFKSTRKRFSIRTDPVSNDKYLIRLKDKELKTTNK